MAKVNELKSVVDGLNAKMEKVIGEIETLKTSLANVEIPADAQASLDRLAGLIQQADDANPDAPAAVPPVPAEPTPTTDAPPS